MALIQRALDLKMPIFGICRGEQILNVALGGTLTIDIPSDVDTLVIHRCPPGSESCLHDITIDTLSQFFHITGISSGVVNSYHHQAAERTAPGMRAVAFTANGVTEVIEREDPSRQPFLMGVQFHPERLVQNPSLAEKLAVYFVKQAMDYDARRDKIVRD
jgi:putative glutamine amidotransferase